MITYLVDCVLPPVVPALPDVHHGVVLHLVLVVEDLLPDWTRENTKEKRQTPPVLPVVNKPTNLACSKIFCPCVYNSLSLSLTDVSVVGRVRLDDLEEPLEVERLQLAEVAAELLVHVVAQLRVALPEGGDNFQTQTMHNVFWQK